MLVVKTQYICFFDYFSQFILSLLILLHPDQKRTSDSVMQNHAGGNAYLAGHILELTLDINDVATFAFVSVGHVEQSSPGFYSTQACHYRWPLLHNSQKTDRLSSTWTSKEVLWVPRELE